MGKKRPIAGERSSSRSGRPCFSISGQMCCAPKFEKSHQRRLGLRSVAAFKQGHPASTFAMTMTISVSAARGLRSAVRGLLSCDLGSLEEVGRRATRGNIAVAGASADKVSRGGRRCASGVSRSYDARLHRPPREALFPRPPTQTVPEHCGAQRRPLGGETEPSRSRIGSVSGDARRPPSLARSASVTRNGAEPLADRFRFGGREASPLPRAKRERNEKRSRAARGSVPFRGTRGVPPSLARSASVNRFDWVRR